MYHLGRNQSNRKQVFTLQSEAAFSYVNAFGLQGESIWIGFALTKTALGLTLGLTVAILATGPTPLAAQSGLSPAPVPGPYQVMIRPQPTHTPYVRPAYNQPMPYWMQNQSRPGGQAADAAPQPLVSRAPQQPFIQGWNWAPQPPNAQTGNTGNTGSTGIIGYMMMQHDNAV